MGIDLGLLVQYILIALAVIASLAVVMHKQFPATTRRLRIALAMPMLREGAPGWIKALGRVIAPAPRANSPGCSGCNSCD